MQYCGIDLGLEATALCVLGEERQVLLECTIGSDQAELQRALKPFKDLRCVVEAAPLAEWLCLVVEELGHKIDIIDPRQAKVITHSKKKTDKIDARKLAELARSGWYNRVHRKSGRAREMRSYMTARKELVKLALASAASIRGILRAHGIKVPLGGGQDFVSNVRAASKRLPAMVQRAVRPLLKVWIEAKTAERKLYDEIPRHTRGVPEVKLLQSVPGVGPATAAVFVATIDDPRRFKSAEQVASYVGVVPKVHQSGETEYRGRITKEGDSLLRWLLVEAAHSLLTQVSGNHPLKAWGLRLAAQKGAGKARVAVARKLSGLLYRIWLSGKPYQAPAKKAAA